MLVVLKLLLLLLLKSSVCVCVCVFFSVTPLLSEQSERNPTAPKYVVHVIMMMMMMMMIQIALQGVAKRREVAAAARSCLRTAAGKPHV